MSPPVPRPLLLQFYDGTWGRIRSDQLTSIGRMYASPNAWFTGLPGGAPPHTLYVPGVGSQFPWMLGAAIGLGTVPIVLKAVKDLVEYRHQLLLQYGVPPIVIMLGYSRGAYFESIAADFLATVGWSVDPKSIPDRYYAYRKDKAKGVTRASRPPGVPPVIDGIVALDRVGRLGLPWQTGAFFGPRFSNSRLSSWVGEALHVLAANETRKAFEPACWSSRTGVCQLAVPGTHGDIGGQGRLPKNSDWNDSQAAQIIWDLIVPFVRHVAFQESGSFVPPPPARYPGLLVQPPRGITTWPGTRPRAFPPYVQRHYVRKLETI